MLDEFYRAICCEFDMAEKDIELCHPLVLAYLGDAVYEVFVRSMLVKREKLPVHMLHRRSVGLVKAKAQSDIVRRIIESLTEAEKDIVRRGRNAKSGTIPKNADVTEYKYATGFETLIGYLYLKRDYARLVQVMTMAVAGCEDYGGKAQISIKERDGLK